MYLWLFSLCVSIPSNFQISKKQSQNICKYENIITEQSRKNSIEPELLASIIYIESGFWPHVVSKQNACGLTQVVPKWTGGPETGYKKYTCKQLKNPRTSISVGAQIFKYIINNYAKGNVDKALCIYNAGSVCLRKKNLYKKLYYVKKVRKIYDTIINSR